ARCEACSASSWGFPCVMGLFLGAVSKSGRGALGRDGVEDADLLPGRAVLVNEPVVRGALLVGVVGGEVAEDDVQPHVPVAVVDLAPERLGGGAAGEEDDPLVAGEVAPAGVEESLPG